MNLWFVCMVKDEADTIGGWIDHAHSEGASGVAILDNGSIDGTTDRIHEMLRSYAGTMTVLVKADPEVGYYQSRKISALVEHIGEEYDAEWIVPADADELWHCADRPLSSFFVEARARAIPIVDAQLLSHYVTALDDADNPDPFTRMRWRHRDVAPLPKVAFRYAPGTIVHQGNHGVDIGGSWSGLHLGNSGLTVRHFPYRSPEQFERKARNGAAAYAAAPDLPPGMGEHWRSYGALLDERGPDALRAVFDEHFYFELPAPEGLIEDPAPYCRW